MMRKLLMVGKNGLFLAVNIFMQNVKIAIPFQRQ